MYAFKKPNCNAAREKTREEKRKNYYNQKQFHKDKKQNTFLRSCIQIDAKTLCSKVKRCLGLSRGNVTWIGNRFKLWWESKFKTLAIGSCLTFRPPFQVQNTFELQYFETQPNWTSIDHILSLNWTRHFKFNTNSSPVNWTWQLSMNFEFHSSYFNYKSNEDQFCGDCHS